MSLFKRKKKSMSGSNYRIVVENSNRIGSMGYTRLKDNVMFLNADGKHKVIQIESSVAHEGKTTVAGNLAVSLSYTQKKVMVMDLDFRRPRTHRIFGLGKELGLAEYVKGDATKEDIIKKTKYENVDVITRGEEIFNAALVLSSDKFKALIAELREDYDYILLDCAPVLQVSDYIHISKVSDGVILLVAHSKTTKIQVAEAIAELKKNDVKILGTVFTMYKSKADRTYYKTYMDEYYSTEEDIRNED